LKCGLIERHRATLVRHGSTVGDADRRARELAAGLGFVFFEDGSLDAQIAGTATVGLELVQVRADTVVVPVGCGALAAGVGLALAQAGRRPRVIGVQSTGFGHLAARFHGREWSEAERGTTFADGLADTRIVDPAFSLCRAYLDDVLLVDDDAMANAMRELWQVVGIVVEGAAAAPLAALRCYPELDWGQRIVLIVSGRNIDAGLTARIGIPASTEKHR
jgi:threonine dehydratase